MQKDLITVVMPTYNDEKYIRRAIDDILKQTYSNFEMLIVNDGSTDNTAQILKEYSEKDNRIKVFHKENGGTGSALNHGFKHANGEFGTWVSSDDYKEPDYLEQLVTLLKDNRDVEFVCRLDRYRPSPFCNSNSFGATIHFLLATWNFCRRAEWQNSDLLALSFGRLWVGSGPTLRRLWTKHSALTICISIHPSCCTLISDPT